MVQGGHQTGVQVRNAAHLFFYFFARRDININSSASTHICPESEEAARLVVVRRPKTTTGTDFPSCFTT